MGVFDFFLSPDKKSASAKTKERSISQEAFNFAGNQANSNSSSSAMDVFYPKSYEDVSAIIDILALGKPAVVNIKSLKESTSQRVLDLLSGAIYALHGGLCELDAGLYLFSTNGVTVK